MNESKKIMIADFINKIQEEDSSSDDSNDEFATVFSCVQEKEPEQKVNRFIENVVRNYTQKQVFFLLI